MEDIDIKTVAIEAEIFVFNNDNEDVSYVFGYDIPEYNFWTK